jgi:hypothetical protein
MGSAREQFVKKIFKLSIVLKKISYTFADRF